MIPARHLAVYVWFFNLYTRWMLKRHFQRVVLHGEIAIPGGAVMMIGNHFSWWDGFIACYINQKVFRKKLHIMMLEEQLRERMFLSKAGAYSIKKGSSTMVRSLEYTADLLKDGNNLVVLYPQGKFSSVYQFPIRFQKGITLVAAKTGEGRRLFLYAALVDYFENRKPTLSVYLKEIPFAVAHSARGFEDAYNEFLLDCMQKQQPS